MKFKKWCISSVDTVKEPVNTDATEKKGLFGRRKKTEENNEAK